MNLLDGLGANRMAQIMLLDESAELIARSVTTNDKEILLELRNDSEVRSNSFSPDIVDPKNHNLWSNKILRSPEIHELFIVETKDGLPIGQVRFDKKMKIGNPHIPYFLMRVGRIRVKRFFQ